MGIVVEGGRSVSRYPLAQEKEHQCQLQPCLQCLYKGHDVREEIQRLMGSVI